MYTTFFGSTHFGGGFFGGNVVGGKGDNRIFKPTGLDGRKRLKRDFGSVTAAPEPAPVEAKTASAPAPQVSQTQQGAVPRRSLMEFVPQTTAQEVSLMLPPAQGETQEQEIARLLRKKMQDEEDDQTVLLLMAALS